LVAEAGAVIVLAGIVCQIVQLVVSVRHRKQLRDTTGDPWNGRTLEWSTTSPPPPWNFALLPQVTGIDAFWSIKSASKESHLPVPAAYEAIHLPRPSPLGFLTAFFAVVFGFALIWHIWWMAIIGVICAIALTLIHSWRLDTEVQISADEVAKLEGRRRTVGAG
jgi:cytochrome o ubiquinol oxidase subunit 1